MIGRMKRSYLLNSGWDTGIFLRVKHPLLAGLPKHPGIADHWKRDVVLRDVGNSDVRSVFWKREKRGERTGGGRRVEKSTIRAVPLRWMLAGRTTHG